MEKDVSMERQVVMMVKTGLEPRIVLSGNSLTLPLEFPMKPYKGLKVTVQRVSMTKHLYGYQDPTLITVMK